MSFYLPEASALRDLDHKIISANLENRRQWRAHAKERFGRRLSTISEDCETNIQSVCELLLSTSYEHKHVVSTHTAWIYTNDLELLKIFNQQPYLSEKRFVQVEVDRPKNTVILKKSNHTHRSYFKMVKLSALEKQQIYNFFINQQNHVRVSPSMKEWMFSKFNRTQDYFFMDHTGENWLLMLALIRPGIIRKTLKIITDK
jgi:hypothetical protein